eukprot:GILK01003513.1.p2 GENE.GILK01003513.1~~GILK01003513.1.p2  ORF type:complete len:160 (+),score=49.27 GILK01003513.1:1494-1973(+)
MGIIAKWSPMHDYARANKIWFESPMYSAAVSTVGQKRPASSTENRFDAFLAEKKQKEQEEEALKKQKLDQKKQKKKKQKQAKTGEQAPSADNGAIDPENDGTDQTVDSSRSGVMAVTVNRHKKRKLATPSTNELTVAELIRQTAPVELLGVGGVSGWDD